jgi:hypothetical protein
MTERASNDGAAEESLVKNNNRTAQLRDELCKLGIPALFGT